MRFDRANPLEHSPVERAILRGLGVERYEFTTARARQRLGPARVAAQGKLEQEEAARLAKAGGQS